VASEHEVSWLSGRASKRHVTLELMARALPLTSTFGNLSALYAILPNLSPRTSMAPLKIQVFVPISNVGL
jgi:hypothetical protein